MKKIDKKRYPNLHTIQKNHDNKDLDELGNQMLEMITKYGLDMKEVSSLMFYITKQTIQAPHNALFLKEKLDLNVMNLGLEGLLKVQQALIQIHLEELAKDV